MSKGFDYSKWDNIELSDDEDDVHPNIERESWFRMKHRSRVEREEREETDKKKIRSEMAGAKLRMTEIQMTLADISKQQGKNDDSDSDDDDDLEDTEGLRAELGELEHENLVRQKKLDDYEKNKKWNVDNICQVTEERTIVNPKGGDQKFSDAGYALPEDDDDDKEAAATTTTTTTTTSNKSVPENKDGETSTKTSSNTTTTTTKSSKPTTSTTITTTKPVAGPTAESVAMMSYHDFTEQYADVMEHFMTLSSFQQSQQYLLLNGNVLLQENSSNYLLLASLEDEMNGQRDKMRLTARQSQIITNIVELARSLRRHPGNVIAPFFGRIGERQYLEGFMEGVEVFIHRIIQRSVVKKKEIDEQRLLEQQEEEAASTPRREVDLSTVPREERLGPGGLDPMEVFDSLPESMQEAFESRDTDKLKEALMAMDVKDAELYMKKCVDSGLWNESNDL